MDNRRYRELMVELCDAAQLNDANLLYETGHLEVDGTRVVMYYEEILDPNRMFVYVELGELPNEAKEKSYRRMLEWNLAMDYGHEGSLGIHPESGHAVLRCAISLDEHFTGEMLAQRLTQLIDRAAYWHELLFNEELRSTEHVPESSQSAAFNHRL